MIRHGMRILVPLIVLAIVPIPAHAESAREAIATHVDKVLEVLRSSAESKAVKEKEVWPIVDETFDYTELSKRVLANHWTDFTSEQQKEFTGLFRTLLGRYYMGRMMQYTDEKVVFGKEVKLSEATVEIQSELKTRTGSTIPINYRMISEKGHWKVYDVVIEGVSLVMNYRNQFRGILSTKPPEELLKTLREKTQ